MKFEELNEQLGLVLSEMGINAYTEHQNTLMRLIKQGKNQLIYSPYDVDLVRGLLYVSFSKAPVMLEGSPRVLWFTNTPENARAIRRQFQDLFRRSDITLELGDDRGKKIEQRNAIFDGTELLIGNPRRLLELYNQNGFHVNQLKLVIVDHLDALSKDPIQLQHIRRIAESLPKCQFLFLSEGKHPRLEPFCEEIATFYDTTTLE
jgi:superfamily II DNA/RNA helicase